MIVEIVPEYDVHRLLVRDGKVFTGATVAIPESELGRLPMQAVAEIYLFPALSLFVSQPM